jgi:hypothetical protein
VPGQRHDDEDARGFTGLYKRAKAEGATDKQLQQASLAPDAKAALIDLTLEMYKKRADAKAKRAREKEELVNTRKVRKTPSWLRSWASFSLL